MSAACILTERDREILSALVQKVRLFALHQMTEAWWNGELANTRRRLKALAAAGLVQRITVLARTLPPVETPVITWQPHQPTPHFGQVSYRLQRRWDRRPVRSVIAFIATERTARLYGGKARGQLKRALQATHDLGTAAVWLSLKRQAPAWAEAWRSEDLLAHTRGPGEKLPDAFIVDEAGEVVWVVEFGGSYRAGRVQAFHEDCAARELPYQIW